MKTEALGVIVVDFTKTFFKAMLETPRQMFAPWGAAGAAAWHELKKNARPTDHDTDQRQSTTTGR